MLPCPAVTVRALSYMNSWCGKRRPESRRRVLLSSVAQCDHFTLLQTLGSTASLAGQGRTQEGGGTELAQYFDSEISPARTGQLTDEALSVHQPVWPDLSLGSQSVLGQSGPREADLESLGDEKASLRWRPLLSLGSIWRKRNEKKSPQTSSLLSVSASTQNKEMVCKFLSDKTTKKVKLNTYQSSSLACQRKNQI